MRTLLAYAALFGATAGAAGCATERPAPTREILARELAQAREAQQRDDAQRALELASGILSNTRAADSDSAALRFEAAMLAARVHLRAASETPFLREPRASGVPGPSAVAHSMAATRCFELARRCANAAQRGGASDVAAELELANLAELAFHSRLGLGASCNVFLQRAPELADAKSAAERFARSELARDRAWLYLALFETTRNRNELEAYRFAVLAIEESSAARGFDVRRVARLERWIASEATLEFQCPKCDLLVAPGLRACPNDRTPNAEFVGRKRL